MILIEDLCADCRAWLKEDGPGSGDLGQWDFIYLFTRYKGRL